MVRPERTIDECADAQERSPQSGSGVFGKFVRVGTITLPTRRANPRLAILGGKRSIEVWRAVADGSFQLHIRCGKHLRKVRFTDDGWRALGVLIQAGEEDGWASHYGVEVAPVEASPRQVPGDKSRAAK